MAEKRDKKSEGKDEVTLANPILVIDDEKDIRDLVAFTLLRMKEKADTADGVADAKAKIDSRPYSLILTDMRMPDGNGMEILEYVRKEKKQDTPIAVITAFAKTEQAVGAMKLGAFDYIQKPITIAHLRNLVESARAWEQVRESGVGLGDEEGDDEGAPGSPEAGEAESRDGSSPDAPKKRGRSGKKSAFPRLLGRSAPMQKVKEVIGRIARANIPIYVTGESGTGKEQAARTIHELSHRAKGNFVPVNCGAIPESLMESEFFGYLKGSFTGANADKDGFFQAADGGTLFLDEVADLPLHMQVKLLRAIQEKAVRKIGDQREMPVDVRIVCATHKNLEKEVAEGRFRQDLYFRLNIVSIHMPSLREMLDDLPTFIEGLLSKTSPSRKLKLSDGAMEALKGYAFPGNFRELENIIQRACVLCQGETIEVSHLQLDKMSPLGASADDFESKLWAAGSDKKNEEKNKRRESEPGPAPALNARKRGRAGKADRASDAGDKKEPKEKVGSEHAVDSPDRNPTLRVSREFVLGEDSLEDFLDEVEKSLVEFSLGQSPEGLVGAARNLFISPSSLRNRIRRLKVDWDGDEE